MARYGNLYTTMLDGTLKHVNPLTGTEVWTVPDRANRPLHNRPSKPPRPLPKTGTESYCDFCRSEYFRTPPEKARIVQTSEGRFQRIERLNPDLIEASPAFLRRVANLFEIVTMDYWRKNHRFELSPSQSQWKRNYLENPRGLEHVHQIIDTKLRLSGRSLEDLTKIPMEEKLRIGDAFFGGSHELVVVGKHFKEGAGWDNEYYSSGEMTPEEHFQYLRFTLDAMADIYRNNKHVKYVTAFQNWLQPAGASFDHPHKQLVGLDEWGTTLEKELEMVQADKNLYNEAVLNFSWDHDLVFAENDHAIALCEIGYPYPTLSVYAKGPARNPWELPEEELRCFSDLLHACHAAMGSQVPCNEEWYYKPPDAPHPIPMRALIKWRTVNPAGFEGGTRIYVNPVSPIRLRDRMVPRLYELRDQGKVVNLRIALECRLQKDCLRYAQD